MQTWLLTIARSRALDRLRAARRLREDSIDDSDASSGAMDGSASVDALDKRSVRRRSNIRSDASSSSRR